MEFKKHAVLTQKDTDAPKEVNDSISLLDAFARAVNNFEGVLLEILPPRRP